MTFKQIGGSPSRATSIVPVTTIVRKLLGGGLVVWLAYRSLWWLSGVLGLALSVEFGQYLFLPERFASIGDLIANTVGAVLGGLVCAGFRRLKGGSLRGTN